MQRKLLWLGLACKLTDEVIPSSACASDQCRGGERQEGCLPAPGPRPLSAVARNQPHLAAWLHLDADTDHGDNNLHIIAVRGPLVLGILEPYTGHEKYYF